MAKVKAGTSCTGRKKGTFSSDTDENTLISKIIDEDNEINLRTVHKFFPDDVEKTPHAFARKWRFSFFNALASKDNHKMRYLGSLLLRDGVPKKSKGYVRNTPAEEWKSLIYDQYSWAYYSKYNTLGYDWFRSMKSTPEKAFKGKRGIHGFNHPKFRNVFGSLVSRKQRGANLSHSEFGYTTAEARKAVDEMALHVANLEKDILKLAKGAGVKDVADIVEDMNYLPRIHQSQKYREFIDEYDRPTLVKLFANAMKGEGKTPLAMKDRVYLAHHLVKVVLAASHTKFGLNGTKILNTLQKREKLQKLLLQTTDLGETKIKTLLDSVYRQKTDFAGARYKYRIRLDETYVDSKTGVGLHELLENNNEALFHNYLNTLSGDIGLAKVGIRSQDEWKDVYSQVVDAYDDVPMHKLKSWKKTLGFNQQKNEIEALDIAYRHIRGLPIISNPDGIVPTMGRFIGDVNYNRSMGQVGWANIAEFGNVTAHFGWASTLMKLPGMRGLMKRAKNGVRMDSTMEELDRAFGGLGNFKFMYSAGIDKLDYTGVGTEILGKAATKHGIDGNPKGWRRVIPTQEGTEIGLKLIKRKVNQLSGQWMTTSVMQIYLLNEMTYRFARYAANPKRFIKDHPFTKKFFGIDVMTKKNKDFRMKQDLGLSAEDFEGIQSLFRKHTVWKDGKIGGKVQKWNLDKWAIENEDLYNKFTLAIRRFTHRGVQMSSLGERAYFGYLKGIGLNAESNLGRLMYQFRGFMFTAWEKHFLHGLATRDFLVWASWMNSMFMGGMAYVGNTYQQSIGHPDRDAFLKQRLTTKEIAENSYQRAAFAAVIPPIMNSASKLWTDSPMFGFHQRSGLENNFVTGNPTYDLLFRRLIPTTFNISRAVLTDAKFTTTDASKMYGIFALQNIIGIQNLQRFHAANAYPEPDF